MVQSDATLLRGPAAACPANCPPQARSGKRGGGTAGVSSAPSRTREGSGVIKPSQKCRIGLATLSESFPHPPGARQSILAPFPPVSGAFLWVSRPVRRLFFYHSFKRGP